MIADRYYAEFHGKTFVVQVEADAVADRATADAVIRGANDLLRHGIRILLVFGKPLTFEEELQTVFHARRHPETHRLAIPETALPRIREERRRIARTLQRLCDSNGTPFHVLPESVVRGERRIGHGGTGVVTAFDMQAVHEALQSRALVVIGFGGVDLRQRFLHVPSVSLAADLAVALRAQKLLFLTCRDGIAVPDGKGGRRQLSFADLERLLCLLQWQDETGAFTVAGPMLAKVHACIRAVAGGVSQIHLVSCERLLEEVLTRTGVGTMIECQQTHHLDFAHPEDLDEITRLHIESQQFTSPHGTAYVKPLARRELLRLLPSTLVLKHRGVIIGKLHAVEVPERDDTLQIGGLVVGEDHHDSQQGRLLLGETLSRIGVQGQSRAIAVTASPRAHSLFVHLGGTEPSLQPWQTTLLDRARQRYTPAERDTVRLFEFTLSKYALP
jgi:acetylglutamate kinase